MGCIEHSWFDMNNFISWTYHSLSAYGDSTCILDIILFCPYSTGGFWFLILANLNVC